MVSERISQQVAITIYRQSCCLYTSETFDSVHRGKMEQILLAYDIPRETIAAIIMLFKNTRAKDNQKEFSSGETYGRGDEVEQRIDPLMVTQNSSTWVIHFLHFYS